MVVLFLLHHRCKYSICGKERRRRVELGHLTVIENKNAIRIESAMV